MSGSDPAADDPPPEDIANQLLDVLHDDGVIGAFVVLVRWSPGGLISFDVSAADRYLPSTMSARTADALRDTAEAIYADIRRHLGAFGERSGLDYIGEIRPGSGGKS